MRAVVLRCVRVGVYAVRRLFLLICVQTNVMHSYALRLTTETRIYVYLHDIDAFGRSDGGGNGQHFQMLSRRRNYLLHFVFSFDRIRGREWPELQWITWKMNSSMNNRFYNQPKTVRCTLHSGTWHNRTRRQTVNCSAKSGPCASTSHEFSFLRRIGKLMVSVRLCASLQRLSDSLRTVMCACKYIISSRNEHAVRPPFHPFSPARPHSIDWKVIGLTFHVRRAT